MTSESKSPVDEAIEFLCAKHLHQCFWLPANERHERLRITYSTTTNFADKSLPAILFCSPMFGSRWGNVEFNQLAVSTGVRILCIDRPGMGGSTRVPLRDRIATWLETVPTILKLLDVRHVSLMSHSAGTTYCLNTLYHLRHILDPARPYVAMIAPWVHTEHSQVTWLNLVSRLPTGAFDSWNSLVKVISQRIAPSVTWSGGAISVLSGILSSDLAAAAPQPAGEKYGISDEAAKKVEALQSKYFFAEDTTAGNEEAMLCLKKDPTVSLGVCDDYRACVETICEQEQARRQVDMPSNLLKIRAFYAASDALIGKGGQKYFDDCWRQDGVAEIVDFDSTELPGTDHDSALLDQRLGALRTIFEEVARSSHSHSAQ